MTTITTDRGTVINIDMGVPENMRLLYSEIGDLEFIQIVEHVKCILRQSLENIDNLDNLDVKLKEKNNIRYGVYNYNGYYIYYTAIKYNNRLCIVAEDVLKELHPSNNLNDYNYDYEDYNPYEEEEKKIYTEEDYKNIKPAPSA